MRSSQHIWGIFPLKVYVWRLADTVQIAETDCLCLTVKYLAYLRKMTRYNPTRGGKLQYSLHASPSSGFCTAIHNGY